MARNVARDVRVGEIRDESDREERNDTFPHNTGEPVVEQELGDNGSIVYHLITPNDSRDPNQEQGGGFVYQYQTPNLQTLEPIPPEQLRNAGLVGGPQGGENVQADEDEQAEDEEESEKERKGEKEKRREERRKEKKKWLEKSKRLEQQLRQQRRQCRLQQQASNKAGNVKPIEGEEEEERDQESEEEEEEPNRGGATKKPAHQPGPSWKANTGPVDGPADAAALDAAAAATI